MRDIRNSIDEMRKALNKKQEEEKNKCIMFVSYKVWLKIIDMCRKEWLKYEWTPHQRWFYLTIRIKENE